MQQQQKKIAAEKLQKYIFFSLCQQNSVIIKT